MTESDDEVSAATDDDVQLIELTRQPIDLYKILKFEGLVGSGGEAKAAIAAGYVRLNDVVETQKRKKVVSGDTIGFDGILYRVHCVQALEPSTIESPAAGKPKNKAAGKPRQTRPGPMKAGRKAIGIKS